MTESLRKFQTLLRELFQFDCADLDFGIYRIMNFKRDVIEGFIEADLPDTIGIELARDALADQSLAAQTVAELAKQITSKLDRNALDADGNLVMFQETDIGKRYIEAKDRAAGAQNREALEARIYNHLYSFFSRYYQDGDFISKRRYSRRERYAIPYNGEEVYLYWANHDQYYVKTAEHFHDYTFTSRGVTVHFTLKAADVEQNNVKGEKRFFVPAVAEIDWNAESSELTIPFEYRPLTEQETIRHGTRKQQENIIDDAMEAIPGRLSPRDAGPALAALNAEKRTTGDGESVSYFAHHLRQYTRRNTSDFFIHKDLRGFLSRELDFYLKNEVLSLDEMDAAGEGRAEGWFQIMRVIKAIGNRIIEFLDQIESFQKMLWEKRKFITETGYCIRVGVIDERFYPEIAACDAQWDEWKELFHIDEDETDLFNHGKNQTERRIALLQARPTLVLDTRHFAPDFADDLLASFVDLDEMTDGLLIRSENYQALSLLYERFREHVKCVYIDPPYNTGNDDFIYKDNYQHSSWLAMVGQTVASVRRLMGLGSVFFASCDDNEMSRFRELLDSLFGQGGFESQVIIQSNKRGQTYKSIAKTHEYLLVYDGDEATRLNGLPREIEDGEEDEYGRFELWELRNRNPKFGRFNRPNLYFPVYVSEKQHQELGYSRISTTPTEDLSVAVYPRNSAGEDSCWRWSLKKVAAASRQNDQVLIAKQTRSGKWRVFEKSRKSLKAPKSIWFDTRVINEKGTTEVGSMGFRDFGFPKPLGLLELVAQIGTSETDVILDFFAGTGTTGHATINVNREDEGERRFLLVEMGEYFDTVLLPRIKKVTYTPEWKDGKPKRMATAEEAERSPRIVKYMRLESYEDALNNIEFDEASGQEAMRFDDYLLKYMLKWETRESETLLNVEKLSSPFRYKLHIHQSGQTREQPVDVPETFNYLLGLHVSTRRAYDDGGRRYLVYRGRIDHRQVAVIWRDTAGWQKEDLLRDRDFVIEQKMIEGADDIFVNGDSFIPDARALEPVFKARMFAPVEA
jgi:adenine-specific DNA-methyltransferase